MSQIDYERGYKRGYDDGKAAAAAMLKLLERIAAKGSQANLGFALYEKVQAAIIHANGEKE
jgi:hypothetical protein